MGLTPMLTNVSLSLSEAPSSSSVFSHPLCWILFSIKVRTSGERWDFWQAQPVSDGRNNVVTVS